MRKVKMKKLKPRKKKPAPKPPTPEEQQLFAELSAAVENMGVTVRQEKGNFRGGVCVVDGEKRFIFLNKKHSMEQQIIILGQAVRQLDSEVVYLSPRVREFIETLPDEPLEIIEVAPRES